MEKIFRYEADLVRSFKEKHFRHKQSLLIDELSIRWGNIDLVEINNMTLPFTNEQCKILSKPSCAKIFMRLKNNRPISKQKLFIGLGLSMSTFEKALSELSKCDLVYKRDNLYFRNVFFVFPHVTITGYEAKLTDYHKALYQACHNKEYVDYSYMVFPLNVANTIYQKYDSIIRERNIGLIGVSNNKTQVLIRPSRTESIKPYIRLMNLALSYEYLHPQGAT